jgi:regulator of sigma E protease
MSVFPVLAALPLASFFEAAVHWVVLILGVLFIFNLIIVVHELGHFLAARWRGLIVEEFGVWFGKPLWRKKFNGVWYSFGTIPFGGFVKLPQLAPMKSIEGESETPTEELPPIGPVDKIITAFAGPLFSFLLALVLACFIWKAGRPYRFEDRTTIVGVVMPGGPADKAGIVPGDKILAIDGKPVKYFMSPITDSIVWAIVTSENPTIHFDIERNGQHITKDSGWVREETPGWRRKALRKVQFGPLMPAEVGHVDPAGPAEKAGLQKGDMVKAVNGTPILGLHDLLTIVDKNPSAPMKLSIDRAGQPLEVTLTPEPAKNAEEGPVFGIEWGSVRWDYPTPVQQVVDSVRSIANMIRTARSPKSDVKAQHFSGPVGIMNLYRMILESEKPFHYAIAFSVFFNVNLALINLLPLPILDGGHIMFGVIELIRRKPIRSIKVLEIMETACTLLILGFILYVTWFDIGEFFHSKAAAPAPAATTPAPATPAPQPSPQ